MFPTLAFREADTMRLCEIIAAKFFGFSERPKAIFVDGVGVGAGVVDRPRAASRPWNHHRRAGSGQGDRL